MFAAGGVPGPVALTALAAFLLLVTAYTLLLFALFERLGIGYTVQSLIIDTE